MTPGGSYTRLLVERHGPVGWLVFNRPDAGNALDATMFDELEAAWLELDADPAVRVIVNTGAGDVFQTGLDVEQLRSDPRRCAPSRGGPVTPSCASRPGISASGSRSSPR